MIPHVLAKHSPGSEQRAGTNHAQIMVEHDARQLAELFDREEMLSVGSVADYFSGKSAVNLLQLVK